MSDMRVPSIYQTIADDMPGDWTLLDLPVDYEELTEAGSIMGSGGMIVMDDYTCMVDVAKYFMNFLRDESCGKCFTCRKGTQRIWEILDDITSGRGTLDRGVAEGCSGRAGLGLLVQYGSGGTLGRLRVLRVDAKLRVEPLLPLAVDVRLRDSTHAEQLGRILLGDEPPAVENGRLPAPVPAPDDERDRVEDHGCQHRYH